MRVGDRLTTLPWQIAQLPFDVAAQMGSSPGLLEAVIERAKKLLKQRSQRKNRGRIHARHSGADGPGASQKSTTSPRSVSVVVLRPAKRDVGKLARRITFPALSGARGLGQLVNKGIPFSS